MKVKSELKERISKGLNYGLEAVEKVLNPETELFNQFILIKSKYNDLMFFSSTNTLPYDELEVGFDKLRRNLILLINELNPSDLKESKVEPAIKNKALPYRRENFFRLLDIHFRNLESIYYEEQTYNSVSQKYEKDRCNGREAIFQRYRQLVRNYKGKDADNLETIKKVFGEFFIHEIGVVEVYLKHIKHMADYIQEAEIDQDFFFNTLVASFSKYELVLLFYYTVCDIDSEFKQFAKGANLFNAALIPALINADHLNYL